MTREEKLARYKHLFDTGVIDQNEYETLVAPLASSTATLTGSGAVSQDGGDALGQGAVKVEGTNHAPINTGTQINTELLQYITIQGEDPEIAKSVIALYLDALVRDLTGLKLGKIDTSIDKTKQQQLQLADIYVPLNTTLQIPEKTTLAHWLKAGQKREQIESE